jgi:hypothetical protein
MASVTKTARAGPGGNEADQRRVEVDAVGYHLGKHGGVLQQGQRGAGFPVVQRPHRVEHMRPGGGPGRDRFTGQVVAGTGVADGRDGAVACDLADGGQAPFQFRRDRDHPDGAPPGQHQPVDGGRFRCEQKFLRMGAPVVRAEPRALQMDPGQNAFLHQDGQRGHSLLKPGERGGDQAGHQRGGAV